MVEITHNSHEACRYLSTNLAHRVKTGPVSGIVGGIPLLTLDSAIQRNHEGGAFYDFLLELCYPSVCLKDVGYLL